MFEWLFLPEAWIALVTLVALEIVLGVDNIVFISILTGRLPPEQRQRGRQIGLALAMVSRLVLLASIAWIVKLTAPLFTVLEQGISGRDLILIGGGLFLLAKSTHEIHNSLQVAEASAAVDAGRASSAFMSVVIQIAIIDIVFSLDSVITAVGLVEYLSMMVIAVIISVLIMLVAAGPIGDYIDLNPTLKILALSFLILIGTTLIAEGFDFHVPRAYIYFSMAFSTFVEMLNIRMRRNQQPIQLHKSVSEVDYQ